MSLSWRTIQEMRSLGFQFTEAPTMHNRHYVPKAEDISAQIRGPVVVARWKDGSGWSAFDEDVNEEYQHRADSNSMIGALSELWLLKNRPINEEFHAILR